MKKRQALKLINTQIPLLEKCTSLVVRQQKECLIDLGLALINAPNNQTLDTIYEQWLSKDILHNKQSVKIESLLEQRESGVFFFNSPDLKEFCRSVKEVINRNPEKGIEMPNR